MEKDDGLLVADPIIPIGIFEPGSQNYLSYYILVELNYGMD